ncbi:MAG: group III truncated hemoglobin, partial [Flavobacteriales bacterium]
MPRDISSRHDIESLVDVFYSAVLKDAVLAPFFMHIDFEHHKPRMVHFWSFVLLDEPGYTTNIVDKHAHMPLTAEAMQHWVNLFETSVRAEFSGPNAEQAILRAKTIA